MPISYLLPVNFSVILAKCQATLGMYVCMGCPCVCVWGEVGVLRLREGLINLFAYLCPIAVGEPSGVWCEALLHDYTPQSQPTSISSQNESTWDSHPPTPMQWACQLWGSWSLNPPTMIETKVPLNLNQVSFPGHMILHQTISLCEATESRTLAMKVKWISLGVGD